MTGRLSVKSMTPYFVVVVGVVLPIYCHIGSGMPYLCIFVEEVVAFLGTMTNKWISSGRELKLLTVANACLMLGPPRSSGGFPST